MVKVLRVCLFGIPSRRKQSEIKICAHCIGSNLVYIEGTFPVYLEGFLRAFVSSLLSSNSYS